MFLLLEVMFATKVIQVSLELFLVRVEEELVERVTDFLRIIFPEGIEINQLRQKHLLGFWELVLGRESFTVFHDCLVLCGV